MAVEVEPELSRLEPLARTRFFMEPLGSDLGLTPRV